MVTCYWTYATQIEPGHPDIDAISYGLTSLDIEHWVNPQNVLVEGMTIKQTAAVGMNADDWGIANGKNLLSNTIET